MIKKNSADRKKDQNTLGNNLLKIGQDISAEFNRLLADVPGEYRRIDIYEAGIAVCKELHHVPFRQPRCYCIKKMML